MTVTTAPHRGEDMSLAQPGPLDAARTAAELGCRVHVLALSDEDETVANCVSLANAGGGRVGSLVRCEQAPVAIAHVLRD
jgi:hypothetical protein